MVASDDDADGIDEGRLMVDRWDTKHLDDAGTASTWMMQVLQAPG